MEIKNILELNKEKAIKIIDDFELYYTENQTHWELKETSLAHQILGTLIMTFKKIEYMEQSLEYFRENDLMALFNIELEEIKIIVEFYENIFIKKGA